MNAIQLAATETLSDVERMLSSLAGSFVRKYGGEYSDILSLCHQKFTEAYHSYDPARGATFSSWCYTKVWRGLQQHLRERTQQHNRLPLSDMEPDMIGEEQHLSLAERVSEASMDVALIVDLILEMPWELRCLIAGRGEGTPGMIRYCVAGLLRKFGWTAARIRESFAEMREILSS